MFGCRSTTSADNIDPAVCSKVPENGTGLSGCFVVSAESVRKACVRVTGRIDWCDARQFLNVWTHLSSTKRAIDADRQQCGMRYRVPECFDRLAGECSAAVVGNRYGDHERDA